MPLPGAHYRMVPMKGGGYERLAFRGNTVVETKNLKTGATHTSAEFARDRKRQSKRRGRTFLTS